MTWKDYVKLFDKDVKQAQSKNIDKVPLVMISDFEFACGEIQALMVLGKQSEMTKFHKTLKAERKQLKDYSIGFCYFDQEEDGSNSFRISIEGFGKPNLMKKNSKKLLKKLGIPLKDIIKGQYTDEVVNQLEKEPDDEALQVQVGTYKETDDIGNDRVAITDLAKVFVQNNKAMTTNVVTLLKAAQTQSVIYTEQHLQEAEAAYRSAASLIDKQEEMTEAGDRINNKILNLCEQIRTNNLVPKYEAIWKRIHQAYQQQLDALEAPFQNEEPLSEAFKLKLEEYRHLMAEITAENSLANN